MSPALALPVRAVGAADAGALVVVEAQPAQRVDELARSDSSLSRAASVSSMRNTRVPPVCRAHAQLNSAVRTRPTCGVPVGDGQKRTRTAGVPEGLLMVRHRVSARALPAHRPGGRQRRTTGFASTPIPSISTSTRWPCRTSPTPAGVPVRMHVAGQQRERAADVRDEVGDVEDHVGRAAVLDGAPVQARCGPRRSATSRSVTIHGPSGQDVSKPLARAHCPSAALRVAGGDVVGAGVAEDHLADALARDVLADPADDDRELALVVHLVGERRQHHRVAGADDRGVGREEHQRGRRARRGPARRRGRRSCGRCRPPCCAG